jgi:hypothetical protein
MGARQHRHELGPERKGDLVDADLVGVSWRHADERQALEESAGGGGNLDLP